MRLLLLGLLLWGGCVTSSTPPPTPPPNTSVFGDPEATTVANHPERPFVASSANPAWEIGLWLMLIIFFICISPVVGRWICYKWHPFWCWCGKCLTKKK